MSSIKKTDHFYLIDGSGYIFRAYYALPPLSRKSDGLPTGAVSGFCNMLYKLLEDARADESKYIPTHFETHQPPHRSFFQPDPIQRRTAGNLSAVNTSEHTLP